MAGILDGLMNDPTKLALLQMGIGILGNNRGNYGRAGPALSAGMQQGMQGLLYAQQYQQEQPMRELRRRQLEMQVKQQEQQATMLAAIQKRMQDNQQPEQPQAIDTGNMTLDPAKYPPPQQPQQQGLGLNYGDVAALNLAGGPNLLDFYKYENEPQERKGGSFYVNPITKKREFIPKVGEGMTFAEDGRVNLAPGYADAVGQITGAQETAKAGLDLVPVDTPQGKFFMTRQQAAQWASGQQPTPQPAPRPATNQGPADFPRVTPQQQAARDSDRVRILQDELAEYERTGQTENADAVRRELSFVSPQGVKPPGQPIVDPENQRKQAEFDRESKTIRSADEQRVKKGLATTDNMLSHLDDIEKSIGFGTVGFVGNTLGKIPGTPGYDLEKKLTTIKSNLSFQELQAMREASPTGGALGNVSNFELDNLQSTVANLDRGQSPEQMMDSVKRIRQHIQNLRGIIEQAHQEKYGPASAQPPTQQPTQKPSNPAASKTFKLDNGKSVIAKYDQQAGKYYVTQNGKKFFVEE